MNECDTCREGVYQECCVCNCRVCCCPGDTDVECKEEDVCYEYCCDCGVCDECCPDTE